MKRAALGILGLVVGCGHGNAAISGGGDASSDASAPGPDASSSGIGDAGVGDAGPSALDECAEAGTPPASLACTGLYDNFATKTIAAGAFAYTPATPLWSDGAQKQRWIELPTNTQIDISNPDEWTFPLGTKLFKEFRVEGKRVETRMFQKVASDFWAYATYAWNGDDSAATIDFGGAVPVGDGGATWNIPTNDDCDECHRGRQDRILGFEQVGLGLPNAQGLTLAQLVELGLVTPAPESVSLTIGDDGTGLDALALAWIHVNCGVTCHNSNASAAGYGAGMLLRLDPTQLDGMAPSAATWDILRTTINVPCVSGSVAGQPRIRPHDAAASALYELVNERGALQMPPIASSVVDTSDVSVVASWIQAIVVDGGNPAADGGIADAGGRRGGSVYDAAVTDSGQADEEPPAIDGGESDDATSE